MNLSPTSLETAALVIDNGSGTTKAGFAGDDAPKAVFPSRIGIPKIPGLLVGLEEREVYAGIEAKAKNDFLNIQKPIIKRQIVNWDAMELLWNHTLYNELIIPPEDHAILLSEAPKNTKMARGKITMMMFEYFNVPFLYLCNQSVLSLTATGRTSGLVLDIGDGATSAVPISEGYVIPYGIEEVNLGGEDLTIFFQKLLGERGYEDLAQQNKNDAVQLVKERVGAVAIDYESHMKALVSDLSSNEKQEILPDGKQIQICEEGYKIGEVLFNPKIAGYEYNGIHKYANESVKKCEEHIKDTLYMNIILSGGSSLFPNIGDRLYKEMNEESKKNIACFAPAQRKYNTWIGGSIIASLSTFQTMWMTRAEYLEVGSDLVNRKCN